MGAVPMPFGHAEPGPKSLFPWEEEEALSATLGPGSYPGNRPPNLATPKPGAASMPKETLSARFISTGKADRHFSWFRCIP
jgi:hypothetical protein